MSAISGMLSVSNAQTDDLVGEWQETVLVRNAKGYNTGSTLFGLMARLKNEPAENTEFAWWEREPSRLVFYSSSASGTATTINVDDGSGNDVYHLLYKNAVLRHDTSGEYIRVTADPSSAAITVAREGGAGGFSGSAVSIADNDTFTLITAAKDEGADAVRAARSPAITATTSRPTTSPLRYRMRSRALSSAPISRGLCVSAGCSLWSGSPTRSSCLTSSVVRLA
jgi:hypothetical protein